ncbi:bifunctional phosphatase PAP2/diacylglycerol kinase family protein [Nocardia callitridis]
MNSPRREPFTTASPGTSTVSTLDRWLVARSAGLRPTSVDRVLRALSTSADHSVLWSAVAAGLFVAGGRAQRRGAVRGLLAVGVASTLANGVAKPLFPRRRPPAEAVPSVRRLITPPVSSSFPSGHAASAAAFATAVALESPSTAAVLAPVAAAVAYSRVHVGVHWPSDVVVGAALGCGVALATRRWWAVRDDEPASVGPQKQIDPLPRGAGLLLVVNRASGQDGDDELFSLLRRRLNDAEILELDPNLDLEARIDERIRGGRVTALGVLGGDGTVSTTAQSAVRHGLPLAVFPGGTLNHFARDIGVEDPEATLTALEQGHVVFVDTAEVRLDSADQRSFVNTASLGGYPDFVRSRERWEHRIGKWPAAGLALLRVLRHAKPVDAVIDGERVALWMLFVGNGAYHPADQIPMSRPRLHDGVLDVRYLRADRRLSRTRLVWATWTGTLGYSGTYVHRRTARSEIALDGHPVALATDGEVNHRARTLTFTSRPAALTLFVPPPTDAE